MNIVKNKRFSFVIIIYRGRIIYYVRIFFKSSFLIIYYN